MTPKLAVLASGGGRSLENLVLEIKTGNLDAEVAQVCVSNSTCGAIERANRLGIPCEIVSKKLFPELQQRQQALLGILHKAQCDLVVLAGWLSLFPLTEEWEGRVLNIHPALLPAYGGKGFWGHHVHDAVLRDKAPISGCTVHFVNREYDMGATILQEAVPVLPTDSSDDLADRVFEAEKRVLPEAIRLLLSGRVRYEENSSDWA